MPSPPIQRHFIIEIWQENRPIFKAVLSDVLLFVFVLVALVGCFVLLELISRAGYPRDRVQVLESLHYWAYLTAFAMFLMNLLWKLLVYLFRRPADVSSVA
jgi:hypothetical protein